MRVFLITGVSSNSNSEPVGSGSSTLLNSSQRVVGIFSPLTSMFCNDWNFRVLFFFFCIRPLYFCFCYIHILYSLRTFHWSSRFRKLFTFISTSTMTQRTIESSQVLHNTYTDMPRLLE